jgi:hypothetical protein
MALAERIAQWICYGLWFLVFIAVSVTSLALLWATQQRYPFGREHCCGKQVGLALISYAHDHDGKFPTGGATPEASLSLLYPEHLDASVLRGKGYPEGPAQELLESGKPLTPETCGWHYVDGLHMVEGGGSKFAIAWDKIGLDHNSGYLPEGGHSVIFMDGHEFIVREADWSRFIASQERAWEAIRFGEIPPDTWLPADL